MTCKSCNPTSKTTPTELELFVTDKGFEPDQARVSRGAPVTLVITRQTERTCAREIVIDEHGVNEQLPLHTPVRVTIVPRRSGELRFGCAMDKMIGGTLIVVEGTGPDLG